MKDIIASDKIYIKKSKIFNAGRGVYAFSNIKKDEEIKFNYSHGNPKDKSPLWFEVV